MSNEYAAPAHGLICPGCQKPGRIAFSWQMRADQVPVIRVECLRCAKFLRWAARTPGFMELADAQYGHTPKGELFPPDEGILRNGRTA